MGELLTVEQTAELLGLSVSRIRQLPGEGRLVKYINETGSPRFLRKDVLALKARYERFAPAWQKTG